MYFKLYTRVVREDLNEKKYFKWRNNNEEEEKNTTLKQIYEQEFFDGLEWTLFHKVYYMDLKMKMKKKKDIMRTRTSSSWHIAKCL